MIDIIELSEPDDRLGRTMKLLKSIGNRDYQQVLFDDIEKASRRLSGLHDRLFLANSRDNIHEFLSLDRETFKTYDTRHHKKFRCELADIALNELCEIANNYPGQPLAVIINEMNQWPQPIEDAYQAWVNSPNGRGSLDDDWTDWFRFHRFAWACFDELDDAPSHYALEKRLTVELNNAETAKHIAKLFDRFLRFACDR